MQFHSSWAGSRVRAALAVAGIAAAVAILHENSAAQCAGTPCATVVPGGSIAPGTVWTLASSPYCVSASITATQLKIDPGVCVHVATHASIVVSGVLDAAGTQFQPITFTADGNAPAGIGNWWGITLVAPATGTRLEHCIIERSSDCGLEIRNAAQALVLRSCEFRDNYAAFPDTSGGTGWAGGGIKIVQSGSFVNLIDCRLVRNVAWSDGGGLYADLIGTGIVELDGCTIEDNLAMAAVAATSHRGGGVYIRGPSRLFSCRIARNSVYCEAVPPYACTALGGGLMLLGDAQLEACEIIENSAVSPTPQLNESCSGGGVDLGDNVAPPPMLTMRNCLLSCNSCVGGSSNVGSAIDMFWGSGDIDNCTIARGNNIVPISGGPYGINLHNTIVCENGGNISVFAEYSNFDTGFGGFGGQGNTTFPPQFAHSTGCQLSDLRLLPSSPCIDRGNPDPSLNDACRPPGQGSPRGDQGMHGGPYACRWGSAPAPATYCTAKVNSLGCLPAIATSGAPSATAGSGFAIYALNVRNAKPGWLVYTVCGARTAIPFQGGTLCLGPGGIRRTSLVNSGGNPPPTQDCSGTYWIDMNAFAQVQGLPYGAVDAMLRVPGTTVHCQWTGRDRAFPPPNFWTLSDAVEYHVGF